MASLSQDLDALAVRMAQECNAIRYEIGPLDGLLTTTKSSIVNAINELVQRINDGGGGGGGAIIDDTMTTLSKTWSSQKSSDEMDLRIETALAALPEAATINDMSTTNSTVWSSTKTNQMINAAIAALPNIPQIVDGALSTTSVWSSAKVNNSIASAVAAAINGLTKANVGLPNVDNTSDLAKPVSTAQAAANAAILQQANAYTDAHAGGGDAVIDDGAPAADKVWSSQKTAAQILGLINDGVTNTTTTWSGSKTNAAIAAANAALTKASVGLPNVDNTSDVNKPVSTLQAAAIAQSLADGKAYTDAEVVGLYQDQGNYNASSNTYPTVALDGGPVEKGDIWRISVAGTLGGTPVVAEQYVRALVNVPGQTAANWAISGSNVTITQSITSGATGTAPSSDAVYQGMLTKEPVITAGTSAQYLRGDKTLATFAVDTRAVTLTGVTFGTATAVVAADSVLVAVGKLQAQATANASALAGLNKASVGLPNVDNTSDANKPVSTAQAAADGVVLQAAKDYADGKAGVQIDDVTASTTKTYSSTKINSQITAATSGLSAAITVKDEGTNLTTSLSSLNFVGAGVAATTTGGAVTVTIGNGPADTDALPEGATNKYSTQSRTLGYLLGGLSLVTGGVIAATDSIVVAFGKLQKQLTDLAATAVTTTGVATLSSKTLTNPTINGFTEGGVIKTAGTSCSISLTETKVEVTTTGNISIVFPSAAAKGKSGTLTIKNAGAHTHTFTASNSSIRWVGGSQPAPTLVNGKWDRYAWECDEAETCYILSDAGRNI